jgi:predicted nuclease of restriction endonuclease-like (RecB) superfamily
MVKSMNPIANNSGFYDDIKMLIEQSRARAYQAVNFAMVQTYWQIGKRIVEEEQAGSTRAGYGENLIEMLAEQLTADFGKGFDKRNLFYMRRFYIAFPIMNALRSQLSWTHYRFLIQLDNQDEREYYLNEAANEHWSTRQLERQIQTNYYQRVLSIKDEDETPEKQKPESFNPADFIKDPYILEFLDLKPYTPYLEKELEQAILNRLQDFLLELGKGFCFVARQKHMATEQNRHYHIDLVFYNYLLRCFVLVDLKIGTLTAEDVGKMDMYVRMYEDQFKPADDNPTLGIILCSQSDETVVKYSLLNDRKQLFASQYRLVVPSEKALAKVVDDEIQHLKNENMLQEKLMHYGKL